MPAPSEPPAVTAALDELYGVEPSAFVATRTSLVADLRAAGDKEAAATVAAARRPTNAAWALNQLTRQQHDVVDAFLARSTDLARAQEQALAGTGDRDALRDATRAHRDAMAAALDAATARLGPNPSDAGRTQILTTLQTATTDAPTAEALRRGRLVSEVAVVGGFLDDGGDGGPAPAAPRSAAPPKARAKPTLVPDERETRRRRAEREAKLRDTEAAMAKGVRDVASAELAVAEAEDRIARLQRELDDARDDRRVALRSLRERRKELDGLTKDADRLHRELD